MSLVARSTGPARRALMMAVTVGLAAFGLAAVGVSAPVARADTTPGAGVPATVAADGLPTWQVNGVVWGQAVVGNTVYVTGRFTRARPPGVPAGGAGEVAAANIFAFDITTGNRVASFSHQMNAQGLAIAASPDGSKIFVGGDFTAVGSESRGHLAAFSTVTGALVANFTPSIGGQVRALATTNATVFAGGSYTAVGNNARSRLSAFDTSTGALLTWAPSANNTVWSMAMTPDKKRVIIGGSFTTLSGSSAIGMGSTDATTGANMAWAANQVIKNSGTYGAITSLRSDGTQIYGAGYTTSFVNNFEGTFAADPTTGNINWVNDCHGDTYDVLPIGQVVYSVSHAHDCSPIAGFPETNPKVRWQHALASTSYPTGVNTGPDAYGWNYNGMPASTLLQWFPDMSIGSVTGQYQAAWTLAGNASYVVAGGEFPTVNGVAQQGLVRFAVVSLAPNKRGPSYNTLPATPVPATTAASFAAGTARVRFGTAWDMDNESLTYDLLRDGQKVRTKALKSTFWVLPGSGFVDTGLVPGSTHTYQVRITDPFGNTRYSPLSNQVTISSAAVSAYAMGVFNDAAASYWRLDEPSGSAVVDHSGYADATAGSGVSRGATGAIIGDSNRASTFNGTSNGTAGTNSAVQAPQSFTLEAWVRTTSTAGGQVIGFGSSRTGDSSNHDRQLYLDNTGRVWFAVNSDTVRSISSTGTYRDGAWHHFVASLNASNGMSLYVDGKKVAGDTTTTTAKTFSGYWRIGGDNLAGLPNRPTSGFLNGTVDDVALYPAALTLSQVQKHYLDSGRILVLPPNQSPTASFTSSAVNLAVSFNGSASSDPDGHIAAYSWNFGDGSPAESGATPSHIYALAGTHQVTLTVTDNQNATASLTKPVTVTPGNQSPTAAFTSSASNLVASFNGSGSSDPDGSIASYGWNFGDGSPAGTGVTPTHAYALAGIYDVMLTVTDNQSASGSVVHQVTVTSPPGTPVIVDTFGRTLASGWGSADTGGTWTGSTSSLSVGAGVGVIRVAAPAAAPSVFLTGTTSSDADLTVRMSADKVGTGNGVYLFTVGRRVTGAGDYRLQTRLRADGLVGVMILRTDAAGAQTVIQAEATVPAYTFVAGNKLNVRFQVTGTSPTTLRAKVWPTATTEPSTWLRSGTDSTAGLQVAGGIGLVAFLSSSGTNPPVITTFDDLYVRTTAP